MASGLALGLGSTLTLTLTLTFEPCPSLIVLERLGAAQVLLEPVDDLVPDARRALLQLVDAVVRAVDGVAQGLLLLLEARLRDLQILEALPLQLLLLLGEVAAQLLAQLVELAQHAVLVLLLELARRLLVGRLRLEELLVEPGVRRLEVAHLRLQLGAHALEHLDLVLHGLRIRVRVRVRVRVGAGVRVRRRRLGIRRRGTRTSLDAVAPTPAPTRPPPRPAPRRSSSSLSPSAADGLAPEPAICESCAILPARIGAMVAGSTASESVLGSITMRSGRRALRRAPWGRSATALPTRPSAARASGSSLGAMVRGVGLALSK
mmetsp:Transcript_43579/g.136731  ORF Transcript_43579/g.136731 Transcript_43579/m.136731 type:complete len:320 (-) Transcript_43579:112-1071(-)